MISITLLKKSSEYFKEVASYRVAISVTGTEGVTPNIFVMQRTHDFVNNKFEDNFVAIATPAQLEDIPELTNMSDSSFYRTYKIELIARTADYLNEIVESVFYEVQKLVDDLRALQSISLITTHTFESED